MNRIRARAQAQFPSVLLTLISIIQALALELIWSKIIEADFLWSLDVASIVGWGMISATLMGILQIWVTYSTLVMGFTWRPMLRDSVLPFVIGIQEFMLISLISGEFDVYWLYVLASIFVVVNYVAHTSFSRACHEPENEQFFRVRGPATLRNFRPAIIIVSVLVLFGVLIELLGNPTWLALLAIFCANFVLAGQIINSRNLWHLLMDLPDE